jgi:hypothetical protein
MSRYGEISPAFAAAFGATISVGFAIGSRNAEAKALALASRYPGRPRSAATRPLSGNPGSPLPLEIPTRRTLSSSRVNVALVREPSR